MIRVHLLCLVFMSLLVIVHAQSEVERDWDQDYPGLFDYIPVDQQPEALNFEEVRKLVGYPPEAMSSGIEGKVLCRILIDEEGTYLKHEITRADHPSLGKAVDPHVHLLRFTPAIQDNQKIVYWTNIKFDFESKTQHYEFAKHQHTHIVARDLKKAEDRARFFLREGKLALKHGNYPSASRMLTQTIAVCKEKSDKEKYLLLLFDAYAERSKTQYHLDYLDEAIQDLTLAIGMARSELDHRAEIRDLLPGLYYRRATYYLSAGQTLEATEDQQWIDKFYPCTVPYAKAHLAELLLNMDKTQEAIRHIDEIEHCEHHVFDKQKHTVKAYVALLKGIAFLQQQAYQEAFTQLAFAQEQNPGNPLTYFYKGLAIWELGGIEHADENLRQALEKGLTGERKVKAEKIIGSLAE